MNRSQSVAIIIPTYNAEKTISKCLESCIMQDYIKKEIIIIDNLSSDSTLTIVEKYKNNIQHITSEVDNGIYQAFNKGIDSAKAEWLIFLGADDCFSKPEAISKLYEASSCVEGCNLVTSQVDVINSDGIIIQSKIGQKFTTYGILSHMIIANPSTLYHKSLFHTNGYFDESYKIAGDYEFILRSRYDIISTHVNETFVLFGGDGVSRRKIYNAALEGSRALIKNIRFGHVYGVIFYIRTLLSAIVNKVIK
jgi:glycosyltransferase involved in cell wall biosynthesis